MTDFLRSAVLTGYADVARSVGLDPYQMLRDVGLSQACLVDLDMRVSSAAVRRLLEDSAALSGVENFGLRMARTRRLSVLGTLGMVVRDAPTVRNVMQLISANMRLHNEALALSLEEAQGVAILQEHLLVHDLAANRQSIELALGAVMPILRFFLGEDWVPRRVCFVHQAPKDDSLHRQLFGPVLEFGAEFYGIICSSADLDRPVKSADPVMARYARTQLEQAHRLSDPTTVQEVRQLVVMLLAKGQCTVVQVARQLGVDRRTVHRQLLKEGVTFSALVNEVRKDLSLRYLQSTQRPLTDIAALLGFSGSSAYSRWHQMQFACAASALRRQARASQAAGQPKLVAG